MIEFKGLQVGDKVLAQHGKYNRMVAYTDTGKVILLNGDNIKEGYVELLTIEERDNCIIADAKNVIYDTYSNIDYKTFLQVLPVCNFKIGYDIRFTKSDNDCESVGIEHQIFAYNMETGIIIVAETFDECKVFNAINVYIPNVNGLVLSSNRMKGFISGSFDMAEFNIANTSVMTLRKLLNFAEHNQKETNGVKNRWGIACTPSLWTSSDLLEDYSKEEYESMYGGLHPFGLWNATIGRILLVDREIEDLFTNEAMKAVFKTR